MNSILTIRKDVCNQYMIFKKKMMIVMIFRFIDRKIKNIIK